MNFLIFCQYLVAYSYYCMLCNYHGVKEVSSILNLSEISNSFSGPTSFLYDCIFTDLSCHISRSHSNLFPHLFYHCVTLLQKL